MIVKDEHDVLARCLVGARRFADEIVVVDTGSSDDTAEIAKKFTDKVYSFGWCDDFSAARNFSFSKATCDLVMWLDADDVVEEEDANKIVALKGKGWKIMIWLFFCMRRRSTAKDLFIPISASAFSGAALVMSGGRRARGNRAPRQNFVF